MILKGYGVTCGGSLLFISELLDFIEESVDNLIKLMIP